jgi:hypothetical protein
VDNQLHPETRSWSPHPPLVALAWLLAVAAFGAVVLTDDRPGQVLLSVATVALGIIALFGTVARPRLLVNSAGVTVRGLTRRRHWSWAEVNVRLVHTRRLGRELPTVELDAEADLVVLGWLDLGADPVDVIEAIRAIRT